MVKKIKKPKFNFVINTEMVGCDKWYECRDILRGLTVDIRMQACPHLQQYWGPSLVTVHAGRDYMTGDYIESSGRFYPRRT